MKVPLLLLIDGVPTPVEVNLLALVSRATLMIASAKDPNGKNVTAIAREQRSELNRPLLEAMLRRSAELADVRTECGNDGWTARFGTIRGAGLTVWEALVDLYGKCRKAVQADAKI